MKLFSTIPDNNIVVDILAVAAWFGLICGLFEGVVFLLSQRRGRVMHVNIEILWVSALIDLVLFLLLGLSLVPAIRILPRQWTMSLIVFILTFITFFDWLGVAFFGRLQNYAILALAVGAAVELARRLRKYEEAFCRFVHRSLPWVFALVLVILFGTWGGLWIKEQIAVANLPSALPNSPNVLVIVVDTLRADHLSGYGYQRLTTPNLDQVAEQGVLFENAVATSAYTLPSHASLFTGRYTHEHGVEWDTPKALFDSPYPTLTEELRSRGYRTAAFSGNLFWFTREFGFGRGFVRFEDYFASIGDIFFRTAYGRIIGKYLLPLLGFEDIPARKLASDIDQSAINWIKKDADHPFFVFLNYMDTHDPYLPPQPYRSRFSNNQEPGGILNCLVGRCEPELTEEQRQGEIDAYDGAIAYVDANIGELFSELERFQLNHNTLAVILSDHGEAFGEHDIYLHDNSLYREVLQVPLIFWWPGRVPSMARVTTPVTIASLPATIMDLIGVHDKSLFPEPSLRALWENADENTHWPYPLAEMAHKPFAPKKHPVSHGSIRAIVTSQWHYIETENLGSELFDWNKDTRETVNLVNLPEMQNVVTQLRSQLSEILRTISPSQIHLRLSKE